MNKKLFLDEIMAYCKYDDHIKEHKAINEMFEIDCDNVSVEEHLTPLPRVIGESHGKSNKIN
jgi:hypothetical protein